MRRSPALLLVAVFLTNCGDDDGDVALPRVRDELLEMRDADQGERTRPDPSRDQIRQSIENDRRRAARLAEILNEHGWPDESLVGREGAIAAWLIAQHADFDVEFQERALRLLRAAVRRGEAREQDLALLVDRVAVNRGRPQTYGSQWQCDENGDLVPRTPIANERSVDERRADVGLEPLEPYRQRLSEGC